MGTIEERAQEYAHQYRRDAHDLKGERADAAFGKAQIEAVEKKQNEYKLIGRLTKVPGHTLYKFNTTTREASKATVEVRSGYFYDPEKGPKMQIKHRFNVKIEKDCYYEQALNMKNFIKRLRRRGIIGADEDVKFVKE